MQVRGLRVVVWRVEVKRDRHQGQGLDIYGCVFCGRNVIGCQVVHLDMLESEHGVGIASWRAPAGVPQCGPEVASILVARSCREF